MLTGYQCEVIAGYTENGEILCLNCAEDEFTKPLIRYALDEEQSARHDGYDYGDDNHVEDCECLDAVNCEQCGTTLADEYDDADCVKKREEDDEDE